MWHDGARMGRQCFNFAPCALKGYPIESLRHVNIPVLNSERKGKAIWLILDKWIPTSHIFFYSNDSYFKSTTICHFVIHT
jgi:hypothetical protein